MSFRKRKGDRKSKFVSVNTFDALYATFPEALYAVDSFGDTILLDHIRSFRNSPRNAENGSRWTQLFARIITTSNEVLVNPENTSSITPIMAAVQQKIPEHLIRHMIDRHPGDPFREGGPNTHFLLAHVVGNIQPYSFEFVKYVFDQNPDAARVIKRGRYETTVLHEPCSAREINLML
mmetsp:Transcript_11637/g.17895  ORF Transcript_11637/g.17895 Transcript_11637/m.17895 type:complete len:178 (-) Transcript_11637:6-539(-)